MLPLLSLVLFGFVIGVIARLLMPGRDGRGVGATIITGIAGALLGGWIGRALGFYGSNEGAAFFIALLGSILLLAVYNLVARSTNITDPHRPARSGPQ